MVVEHKSEKVSVAVFDYLVQTGWARDLVLDFIGTYMSDQLPVLVVKNLSFHAGRNQILEGVGFDLLPGEILGISGRSGSGKSTLLHAIAGLIKPSSGVINIRDEQTSYRSLVTHAALGHQAVGIALQNPSLYPDLTVMENLLYIGQLYNLEGDQAKIQAQSVCDLLGLSEESHQRVGVLAHAKQRIVEMGVALMNSPQILLLDNPAEGLDEQAQKFLRSVINKVNSKGISIVLVSSDKRFLESTCSRIAQMNDGKLAMMSTLPMIERKNMYTFSLRTRQKDYLAIQGYLNYLGAQNIRQSADSLMWETKNPEFFLQEVTKSISEHQHQLTELSCEPLVEEFHEVH